MSQLQKTAVNLVTSWLFKLVIGAIALSLSLSFAPWAIAVTQELELQGDAGYRITTIFNYDANSAPKLITEHGVGKTEMVNSMQVSFYNPAGELIATYDNIVDGIAKGDYFEFNFDPVTKQLTGNIDLGGEFAGEVYLKGETKTGLSLVEVDPKGEEKIIDRLSIYKR